MADQETWTTLKVLNWTRDYLTARGVENARLEAEWMLCAVTKLDRVGLYLNYDKPLNEKELSEYRIFVSRRGKREPLQHILGSQEFFGLEFEVSSEVLVPRHDTEVLVSQAIQMSHGSMTLLDIGTGSGCVAVSLKKHLAASKVTATDISEAALTIARRNAERHGVEIELLSGSLLEPVTGRSFDLIVSNPPYIPSSDIDTLEREVREYDPRIALDGGADGLDIYRSLIPRAAEHLNHNGSLLVEIGIGQASDVSTIFVQTGRFTEPCIIADSAGIDRVIAARLKDGV